MEEKQAQTLGMLCHLLALAGIWIPIIGPFIGPLIIWLMKKDESPFIDENGKESLNFQITMAIAGIIAGILSCLGIGIILALVVLVVDVVFVIIASIKVSNGELYKYPFALRLIK